MMAQLRIDFQGRGKVEALSRSRVQPMGDGIQLTLGVARQVCPLGEVLAQQPVRVFIGAALPRAVRIGKEDLDCEPFGQALVFGHLFPPIIRQGFAQQRGHVPEFLREARPGTPGIRPVHPSQKHQARRPLHQGSNSRPIAGPLDEVAFPVAGHRAGRHLGGTFVNRRHVGDLAASIRPSRPGSARLARLTQRRQPCAAQGSAWQHIQPHIDGLRRQVFPHVVRIRASEASSNLLRRAALHQLCLDLLPQPRVEEFAWPPRVTGAGDRQGLRRTGAIGSASRGVASRLAADGAGGSPQHPGHPPQRMALGQSQAQGLTVFSTQVCVAVRWHGNTVAHQGR